MEIKISYIEDMALKVARAYAFSSGSSPENIAAVYKSIIEAILDVQKEHPEIRR